ncbi:ABC transporter permease subunit [Lachnospiraceae bacterium OttesenSCG-928-E19]|nr:ABC transporter permease subunit [Lachnospiraceae bacterium OttesenSCG-928-E19]
MKSLLRFVKKEGMEQIRSGKCILLGIIFILLAIMNPGIAKMTPWLMETMSDSLAQAGMTVSEVTVSAMDSWTQFFKNIPMGLIVFILVESSIFTREYQTGTLVLALTKGLKRYKVVASKTIILLILWTLYYGICFGITYGYNAYFWDNAVAESLIFSVICWWLFGIWVITLVILFSTVGKTNIGVLGGAGGLVVISYVLGLFSKLKEYTPTLLMDGTSLIYGMEEPEAYLSAISVALVLSICCLILSIPLFNRKQI